MQAIYSIALVVCLIGQASIVSGQPVLPGHERFKTNEEFQTVHAGRLLVNELKCVACHATSSGEASEKVAPHLGEVTSRAKWEHLKEFILDPHATKPGTSMPTLLSNDAEAEAKADALLHYLGSLSPDAPAQSYATFGGKRRGKKLFHSVGCVACHNPEGKDWANSIPLGKIEDKYTLPTLAQFIRNPLHTRPSGRMPSLNLTNREANDIATYLLPRIPEKAGIEYAYYELDNVNRLPDFSALTPEVSGTTSEISIAKHAKRGEQFGLRFSGVLEVTEAGKFRFFLGSDDGSQLIIDDKVVIDNDGVHGMQRKEQQIDLKPGKHTVVVEFFERDGGEELEAEIQRPNGKRGPLAAELVSAEPQEPLEDMQFTVDSKKAAMGKQLFASLGCASCHDVGKPVTSTLKAPELTSSSSLDKGCLATSNPPANYHLDQSQRDTLTSYLKEQPKKLTAEEKIQHTMLQFNCVACHQRGELGGVQQERGEFFQTTQKEMGIEGSIPPHLNGVGAKITLAWLKNILAEGAKDRPYMLTRMPKFGSENVGALAEQLAEADKLEPLPQVAIDKKSAKKIGHRLVGDKGFSCIKCHTFGRHKATGVQSIDMAIMTKRLREDWFRQYVRNPQAYRKGTRMPTAWPVEGKSYLPDLLDGDSDKQIATVWTYLKDGTAAITPSGLATGSKELIPIDEAIIYRNFIQDAGARAIAVGYPEGRHLAFDANELRLALIWKGAFMNAKRHWTGRGQGYEPPAGESVQRLVDGVPIAALSSPNAPWPSLSARDMDDYRFRGYQLTKLQYPTFRFQAGKLQVHDQTLPKQTDTATTLERTLTISGAAKPNTFLRLARGEIAVDQSRFEIGDGLKVEVQSTLAPIVRKSDGSDELVIPISQKDGSQTIVIEYIW